MIDCFAQNGIHVLQFKHGKVNAMDMEFCTAVIAELKRLEATTECGAIVMRSQSNVFSAGIDLKRFLTEGSDYVEPFMLKLEELFQAVFCCRKPLVAEINGAAIAGGCMIAAAADYRVIKTDTKIGILESRLGVPLPMTAIEILRHVANPAAFKQIVSVGATFIGQQAVDQGLADCVSSNTETSAIENATELAHIPSKTFQLTKLQRTAPVMRIINANQEQLMTQYLEIWNSRETRNAIQTYVEERLK